MKKLLFVILCVSFVSCGIGGIESKYSLVVNVTDSFTGKAIHCDSYSIDDRGKYTFFDRDGKYVGECIPGPGFSIEKIKNKEQYK